MSKIKTVLVEDDPDWLSAIKDFLNTCDDILVVASAFNKEEAIDILKNIEADVVVMDINMSGNRYDGILASAEILQESNVKVIMLTSLDDNDVIVKSFTVGAVNFILKKDYRNLPDAIRVAKRGSSPYEVLLNEYSRLKQEELVRHLTDSEREVLNLLDKGYTSKQIRQKLFVSENTVKTHIKKILSKLGVKRSKDAVKKVRMKGFYKDV